MTDLEYLHPQTTSTLREGVEELRQAEGADGDASQDISPDLLRDIDVHDAIHVLFGCPTSLEGEIAAHVWTMFGTTVGMKDMRRVNTHRDHRAVLAEIGHRRLAKRWARSLPVVVSVAYRAFRMTRRWPADELASYLEERLCDVRREFGIRLADKPSTVGPRGGAALRNLRSRRYHAANARHVV